MNQPGFGFLIIQIPSKKINGRRLSKNRLDTKMLRVHFYSVSSLIINVLIVKKLTWNYYNYYITQIDIKK